MIKNASGCCFLALDTGRIMLQLRSFKSSFPLTWSFWGGKANKDERPVQTLLRECKEEMGLLPEFEKIYPIHTFESDDKKFIYNTFCITVFEEFMPQCNDESSGYAWVNLNCWPKPLHRGAKLILDKPEMVGKIKTIFDRQKNKVDLPNWLDDF